MSRLAGVLIAALLSAGCYHATIDTGRAPSMDTIVRPWANSWVYGLVPPQTLETAQRCQSGVAKVETMHSFLNGLVGALTFGIYTPMTLKVTCAQSGSSALPAIPANGRNVAALGQAIELSRRTRQPVFVRF